MNDEDDESEECDRDEEDALRARLRCTWCSSSPVGGLFFTQSVCISLPRPWSTFCQRVGRSRESETRSRPQRW